MAYVALPAVGAAARQALGAARLDAIQATRADLSAAVAVQRQLLDVQLRTAETFEDGRLPRLSWPPRYLATKLAKGLPVMAGEPIPVPAPVLKPVLLELCG